MDYGIIKDLDKTIRKFVQERGGEIFDPLPSISFTNPTTHPGSAGKIPEPGINFFLYDIRENLEMRTNDAGQHPLAGLPTPIWVDFSYLVTALSEQVDADLVPDEHEILGKILKLLLEHPVYPEETLYGSLRTGQALFFKSRPLLPGLFTSMGEFWQAMGGKPRAALNYTVTVGVVMPEKEPAKAVEELV
ncbi:MAG: DUF4255 domain-containing protein, partial [Desulfobacterales bacterium]|nr:DUF4255 domain-containing protein [Desulfobacterales bacterium]